MEDDERFKNTIFSKQFKLLIMKKLLFVAVLFLITACTKTENLRPDFGKSFNPGLSLGKPIKDTEAPVVRIMSPLTGATAEGLVTINVNATDNVGVTEVALKVNGLTIGTSETAPCTFIWDATNVAPGTYLITASVRDRARNITDYSIMLFKYEYSIF